MGKEVHKVRQSIKQRKRNRAQEKNLNRQVLPFTATEEEKHGFFDSSSSVYDIHSSYKKEKNKTNHVSLFIKGSISIVLFISAAFILQTNHSKLQQVKQWTQYGLEEEFPFAQVNEWYVSKFGSPLSFTPQGNIQVAQDETTMVLPVVGPVVETFATNGTGIMISPEEKTVVSAINRGVVIFSGNDHDTGKTVIIQHGDGSETTYGYLSSIDVHVYQFVNTNETIGTFQPTDQNEVVYFSIEKDNQFIDPSQVIPVGDIP